jgi:hypothetical protein
VTFSAPWARFLGLAILLAATALTLWARFTLGLMWSAHPRSKRATSCAPAGRTPSPGTPIYTGLLGMLLGTMLVAGAGPWIVPFPVHDGRVSPGVPALPQACAAAGTWPPRGHRPPGRGGKDGTGPPGHRV